jgi:hypothetical protein
MAGPVWRKMNCRKAGNTCCWWRRAGAKIPPTRADLSRSARLAPIVAAAAALDLFVSTDNMIPRRQHSSQENLTFLASQQLRTRLAAAVLGSATVLFTAEHIGPLMIGLLPEQTKQASAGSLSTNTAARASAPASHSSCPSRQRHPPGRRGWLLDAGNDLPELTGGSKYGWLRFPARGCIFGETIGCVGG